MADISKCKGIDCPVKLNCYRYTAPNSYFQSWMEFYKELVKDTPCAWFWDNTGYRNITPTEKK